MLHSEIPIEDLGLEGVIQRFLSYFEYFKNRSLLDFAAKNELGLSVLPPAWENIRRFQREEYLAKIGLMDVVAFVAITQGLFETWRYDESRASRMRELLADMWAEECGPEFLTELASLFPREVEEAGLRLIATFLLKRYFQAKEDPVYYQYVARVEAALTE